MYEVEKRCVGIWKFYFLTHFSKVKIQKNAYFIIFSDLQIWKIGEKSEFWKSLCKQRFLTKLYPFFQ